MTVTAVFDTVAELAPRVRAGLIERRDPLESENASGDTQLAADDWADTLFGERLTAIDGVGEYASEERDGVTDCGEGLSVAVDPLDGSSNLQSNNPVGTIVGVYDADLPARGRDLVAAGYVIYGPTTTLTVARDGTVRTEALVDGDRRPVERDQTLPGDPTVFGFGGGPDSWTPRFAAYAEGVQHELKCRYGGALVADVNQVLEYGGVFAYPELVSRPSGKLRHQFEGAPIAYVIETAGGASSDGRRSLLDRPIDSLHDRTPVHVGSRTYIDRLEEASIREVPQ
jgi:fructose-1,6-bisphosphatase I